ncbi:obscurin isoform X4 [Engraulis encrasicolus]|uniref:obscurin isoform X4 n=1 Tax=Engraulis encrasicolus TaxID=184585 RepID=UPI002FD0D68F
MDVFGGAPRFLAYPRPVVVQTGTDAVLKCQISGDPRPAVIWERNNEQVEPDGRYRLFEDGNVYNLIITSVTTEDSGQYICKAKNCIGETYAAATLKVEGEAQEMELREENKPRFLIKPLSTRVARGEDAVFSCKLWGNPRPEVMWEKDGRRLNEIFESTHFSVGYQEGGWFQLKIFKTRAPDGGVYTCKARNEFGEGLAGAVLLVDAGPGHDDDGNRNGFTNGHWKGHHQGKPRSGRREVSSRNKEDPLPNSTKVKMFAVTEGKHAKFRCYVTGKPKPEIIWRKDGRLIMSGRRYLLYEDREGYFTLKVLYCKQQDNGVYVCAASNTAGQTLSAVHLSVKEPPVRFKQPLIDLQVWERDLAVLECEVPEDGVPITWYLEDRRLQPGAKYGMEEWGTKRRLTIRDIGVDDDGIYLCEMADGGRSIAEVAVKGTIVRKLPRKVDVLEGENAAFCVEVEEEEMDIHWYKDGVELKETHQTILKSFGRTHILVFVNTTPQDSGLVTFYVGRSKTSSQLRVKGARHCPPSCPVGVQINTERANAALLSWVPAPDSRKNPPSGYVLERQEVGSQEWLQCLTTDSATSVEILGDSVPCEADYRFRICSVNKYGRSGNVEFPRTVHLVPVARIQAPLQDALVPEGQDACFTIELSASVIGTWFLNGTQLQEDDQFSMRRTRTHQSLRIRGVRDTDNGAEITFIAYGIRDSAALYIQAPLVKFTTLSEMDRNKFVEVGNPIVLYCELSDPAAPVHWYKNGTELQSVEGLHIQSEGTMRRIVIQSAEFSHSGVYSCDAIDDVIRFNVEVEAPPARFSQLPDSERSRSVEVGRPIALQCELSDPTGQVYWYKDGTKLQQQSGLSIQSDGIKRTLVVQAAEFCHSGMYSCKTKGDAVQFNVDVKAPPLRFSAVPEAERRVFSEAGGPVTLHCNVSDPAAHVLWHKDGMRLCVKSGLAFQAQDSLRTLHIESAELADSGMYSCATKDDAIQFHVEIRAKPVRFAAVSEDEKSTCVEAGCPLRLQCELSDPSGSVRWYKDGQELLLPAMGLDAQAEGALRWLAVQSAEVCHAGQYSCQTPDDSVHFTVEIKAQPVKLWASPEAVKCELPDDGRQAGVDCEISDPTATVCWYKDEVEVVSKTEPQIKMEGTGMVVVHSRQLSGSEKYGYVKEDGVIQLDVQDQAASPAPVTFEAAPEVEKIESVDPGVSTVPQWETVDPTAQASWHKAETEPFHEAGPVTQSTDSGERTLANLRTAELISTGIRDSDSIKADEDRQVNVDIKGVPSHTDPLSEISDDSIQCTVERKVAGPLKYAVIHEVKEYRYTEDRSPLNVDFEMSHPTTSPVYDYYTTDEDQPQHLPINHPTTMQTYTKQTEERRLLTHYHEDDDVKTYKVDVEGPTMDNTPPSEAEKQVSTGTANPVLEHYDDTPAGHSMAKMGLCEDELHYGSYETTDVFQHGRLDRQSTGRLEAKVTVPSQVCQKEKSICKTSEHTERSHEDRKATHVKCDTSAIPEIEESKSTDAGCPIELQCEVSHSTAPAYWYKDGTELLPQNGFIIQSEATVRRLIIPSAQQCHTGVYSCKTVDDVILYKVDVKAPPPSPQFSAIPEADVKKCLQAGSPTVLHREISNISPAAEVSWYKDAGVRLHQHQSGNQAVLSEGAHTTLVVPPAGPSHSGTPTCETQERAVHCVVPSDTQGDFKTDPRNAPPVKFCALPEDWQNKCIEAGCPFELECEISNPAAPVSWYKDGRELEPQGEIETVSEGAKRKLSVPAAGLHHTGMYTCRTADDAVRFNVDVKAPSPKFIPLPEVERNKSVTVGQPIVLMCGISDCTAEVSWYKDGEQLSGTHGVAIEMAGKERKLVVESARLSDSGHYSCAVADDAVSFKVDVQALPVRFSALPDVARNKFVEAECPIVLQCELSEPTAQVSWYKDGQQVLPLAGLDILSEGALRRLTVQSAELRHSGVYSCRSEDDHIEFKVDVAAPPVRFSDVPEIEKSKSIEAGHPISLHCEISNPTALVQWYKDGEPLLPQSGIYLQTNGTTRTLVIQSAEFSCSGLYSCKTADDISEFYVEVKAPPVTFAHVPEADLHKNIVEQECLTLSCEVSRPDAFAQWFKDGVEVQPDDKTLVETDGTIRKLIIQVSQLSDSGTYTCRAGDSVLMFKVNVREPPVKIVYPKEDVHLDRHVPEEIVLSCELSRANGSVNWFKDGQKLQDSENIKLKTEGPYRRLKILRSRVEDSGEYVCDTADDRIFFQLNITEPPVRIVSPSQSQMELCQQTAERMVLSCEISRANANVRWYRDGLEVEENDNLILEVDGVYRRLIIPKTTVQDTAEYACDTGDDSVTFFVNIAEPPVRFLRPRKMACGVDIFMGDPVLLECEVSRPNAEVTWKKNGEDIEESSRVSIVGEGLIRQLAIQSALLEDSGQYVCDAKDDVMDFQVSVTEPPIEILRKDEIETEKDILTSDALVLKCELSRWNGTVHWYKDNQEIVESDHMTCESEGAFRSLVILDPEVVDTGAYTCDARDDKVVFHVTVREPPVTIVGNSERPERHSQLPGDELILQCEVSRPNAPVEWYCNRRLLVPDSRTLIECQGTVRKLVLKRLELSDAGQYMCDAVGDKTIFLVKVQEPPTMFVNKDEENQVITCENDRVTLCAKVNRDKAHVGWLKDGESIIGTRFEASTQGRNHYLIIDPVKKSDSGRFTCTATTDEMEFIVLVKELKVRFAKPLQDTVGLKDSEVTLRCELYKPRGDVQWLKDKAEITPSHHFTIRANECERSLTIHNLMLEDSGIYSCESKDARTSAALEVQKPRVVEFIAELHNITVMEGEDATFKCVLSPEDARLAWRMNGKPICADEKFTMSSCGLSHTLHILSCQVSDTAVVSAEAEGVVSKANLRVQEAQVLFTKNMEDVVAEEYGEATLVVEVSLDSGEVQWMRHGVVIQAGPKFTLKHIDRKRSLTIHKLVLSDRGTYSCETLHDRTQAQLTVEPRKIKIRKGLSEIQTFERETASFEVELSHGNVEGAWMKDGIRLKANSRWRLSCKGRVHALTISSLAMEDSGTYTFSTENARTSARLIVKETPVTILKKLEDGKFPEASAVTLECELSRHTIEVKWTKDGVELKPGKNHRIYSMGRKRVLQILRCEMDDSGVYMCDAGDTSTSCSLEIYEPELEVVQGLEDLDIQEDENAVFMCELSLDSVPGEWFKNGERIKPTSLIRIRQEGTKHFLLMCNVKGEDSGEIKFVAKNIESTAYLEIEELPVNIVNPLQDQTALEKSTVSMDCTVSNPRCSIRWYKGSNVILPSERFEICSEGCDRSLIIQQVALDDEGMYSIQVGEHSCSAKLTVEGTQGNTDSASDTQSLKMVRELQDVEVCAPCEACFECEVSAPGTRPVWTLKGESLEPSSRVLLEKMGTVHRLTLRQTSADMSGEVQFTYGKAKSTANLVVKGDL